MALRPKGTFDPSLQAQDLRFYRIDGTDEEGNPTVSYGVTGLYQDSEGRVYSEGGALGDFSTVEQRQAVKAISDALAAVLVAKHFEEV